jgi:2-dehydro-3-deoxygluconokinase
VIKNLLAFFLFWGLCCRHNGAGDAYAAVVLYGLLNEMPMHEVVNWGAAAGCLKHYCRGDINLAALDDIQEFAGKHFTSVKW